MAPQKFRSMKKFLHNTIKFNEHYCLKISTNKAPSAGNTPVRIMLLIIKLIYGQADLKTECQFDVFHSCPNLLLRLEDELIVQDYPKMWMFQQLSPNASRCEPNFRHKLTQHRRLPCCAELQTTSDACLFRQDTPASNGSKKYWRDIALFANVSRDTNPDGRIHQEGKQQFAIFE